MAVATILAVRNIVKTRKKRKEEALLNDIKPTYLAASECLLLHGMK